MVSQRQALPASWANYENGGRHGSSDSTNSTQHISFSEEGHGSAGDGHLRPSETGLEHDSQDLRRKRSSVALRFNSLRQAGGVNSFDNFARSWQRAAAFHEVAPVRPSFIYSTDDDDHEEGREGSNQRDFVRATLAAEGRDSASDAVFDDEERGTPYTLSRTTSGEYMATPPNERQSLLRPRGSRLRPRGESIVDIEPQLASPFGGSYGTTWGSLASRANEPSMMHAGRLFKQQQIKGSTGGDPDKEREPVVVRQVQDDDGKVVNVIVGQSTLPQTIFNSVNVLIGVGILALPLALKLSGWVAGIIFLLLAGVTTCYTAKLLAKCADVDSSLITFADLAYVSFGPWARVATSVLFCLELLAACVALVVLFSDSLNALVPWGLSEWKVVCGIILIPLIFMPLRLLSYTSILGILSCFGIVGIVIIDGFIKPETPGSLREPAKTYLFPSNWMTLPISFGILMSPFGGHAVFPSIYRDMRHPYKYRKAVNATFGFTLSLDLLMAVVGLLMFGDGIKDEVTRNILTSDGYPAWLSLIIVISVAIIPLTKIPLNARPIISTIEIMLGLDPRAMADTPALAGLSGLTRGVMKLTIRISCVAAFVIFAILVPEFDTIMSLVGAIACFTVCIILPCAFHLKLFNSELSRWEKARDWFLIVVSSILAIVSTAFNFVPKEKLGM
ncbi:Hypothetical protein R9X50_00362200 [Acrodontium crateriforme]|uniref:Amino acid transporter transmembrane domain-containing protein n=1 Tax=Acrodontium crateriforme TaxID=150365 RepID=A0AAQ3M2V3_9PEZI|nr:Hypothetical protein R9X50_00362200 [Acrodontium crateriforme]